MTTNTLIVTTDLVEDHWTVSAELGANATIPREIFLYENSGLSTLGGFFGTCSITDLTKFQVFSSTSIPIFGNRYLRHDQAKVLVYKQSDLAPVIATLVKNVSLLKTAYLAVSTQSQTFIL